MTGTNAAEVTRGTSDSELRFESNAWTPFGLILGGWLRLINICRYIHGIHIHNNLYIYIIMITATYAIIYCRSVVARASFYVSIKTSGFLTITLITLIRL